MDRSAGTDRGGTRDSRAGARRRRTRVGQQPLVRHRAGEDGLTRVLAARWLTPRLESGDTLYDNGGVYAYAELNLTPAAVHHWQYDAGAASFVNAGGRTPDWLVLHESPIDAPAPAALIDLARTRYDLVFTATASTAEAESSVYDRQDAFFMPIAGFSAIERPGPTIRVYRRREAPLTAASASSDVPR